MNICSDKNMKQIFFHPISNQTCRRKWWCFVVMKGLWPLISLLFTFQFTNDVPTYYSHINCWLLAQVYNWKEKMWLCDLYNSESDYHWYLQQKYTLCMRCIHIPVKTVCDTILQECVTVRTRLLVLAMNYTSGSTAILNIQRTID